MHNRTDSEKLDELLVAVTELKGEMKRVGDLVASHDTWINGNEISVGAKTRIADVERSVNFQKYAGLSSIPVILTAIGYLIWAIVQHLAK